MAVTFGRFNVIFTGIEFDEDNLYCCDLALDGKCGNSSKDCFCEACIHYGSDYFRDWKTSEGKLKWRYDGKCGFFNPLPDNEPALCDPDGEVPCCDNVMAGKCGNTIDQCSCENCADYRRLNREWKESGGTQKWRYDGRCGILYPLPDGSISQCDPDGEVPCCDNVMAGKCGNTTDQCSCENCADYKRLNREWKESGGTQKWRYDGRCGILYPLPDGSISQCDPDGEVPCCDNVMAGKCGNTTDQCSCENCADYKRLNREWKESGGTQKWRYDGRCGILYPLPDGSPAQCDPDGKSTCCNDLWGECGDTANHCFCDNCTDYKFLKDFEESGGELKWRQDGKCGKNNTLPDGSPAECDPNRETLACCSHYFYGDCGSTDDGCSCKVCSKCSATHTSSCSKINYKLKKDWEESGGTKKWRYDGKCGSHYLLPDGTPGQCNPDGEKPCCNDTRDGRCSGTKEHCSCDDCTDYSALYREWRESRGTLKWRSDRRCGFDYPLPDGTPAECNPDGENSCCEKDDWCVSPQSERAVHVHCMCEHCVDYSLVRSIRASGKDCTAVKMYTGFLKRMCFDENRKEVNFECANSEKTSYNVHLEWLPSPFEDSIIRVDRMCKNDPYLYQACGLGLTKITNKEVLCGGYFCGSGLFLEFEYHMCAGDDCKRENWDCNKSSNEPTLCNDECDSDQCADESFCNGYKYRFHCIANYDPFGRKFIDANNKTCGKSMRCENGPNENNCIANMACTHYFSRESVPILNYTRCSFFDLNMVYPYCLDYLDQTNCSDIERVGGFCEVNGYMSTVSKYLICFDFDKKTNLQVNLCDDDYNNKCFDLNIDCKIHKHKMCDGVKDCFDGSDEIHDMCEKMTDKTEPHFKCTRRFLPRVGNLEIPLSWIMDNEVDCMNGADEKYSMWDHQFCPGKIRQFRSPSRPCQNVLMCPKSEKSVPFDKLCDGVESCDENAENDVCRIARDFPMIDKTISSNGSMADLCNDSITACETKEFKRPSGDVFGEINLEISVPTSKVNCSRLFGEHYLYLSCMNLCKEEGALCPLNGEDKKLDFNSCPGQFPHRAYTLRNDSYLTFLDDSKKSQSDSSQYHQNFYKCDNSRCVDYMQVCDLVDDCGDMSDEINCANHMICEDTLNSTKHQFISFQQKCDGIYDCFDLSDECNDSCTKQILENWFLKIFCWTIGFLAVFLNLFTVTRDLASLKDCTTEGMMTSKVLMTLISSGDFLIGLYLVLLSVYDSFVFGASYCRKQAEWLTGTACLSLGVISTIGSQVSLFTMTVMSCIRIHGIRSMKIPGPVNKKAVGRISLLVGMILVATFSVAFIPLLPQLEDYFVQGMYYDPDYKVFIGFPTKDKHVKVLEAYYEKGNISSDPSWSEIGEKVDVMFSQDYGMLSKRPVHFYGNDGVCLFKYFVRTDDARRSRQSPGSGAKMNDPVVWTMLAVNLICFSIITICYTAITLKTRQSIQDSGQQDDPLRMKKVRAIQHKIMMIIATDFLCWVPFIFISGLHNLQYIDASTWYATFAMIVLPLNSVINPLIYDAQLKEFLKKRFRRARSFGKRGNSTVSTQIQGRSGNKEQGNTRV